MTVYTIAALITAGVCFLGLLIGVWFETERKEFYNKIGD